MAKRGNRVNHTDHSDLRLTFAQWGELEAHFQAALELDDAAREAYLDAHCPDPKLRRGVRKLLDASDSGQDHIAEAIGREAQGLDLEQVQLGMRLGPYRIDGKIAEGGMGAVYRGERADGAFQQTVAIKLLRQALPSSDALARFRQERQVLASLEHPGIARLLDGGSTPGGIPYLIMEFVDGVPIDEHCQGHHLPVDRRVRLFQEVCGTVQAAHQSLVVHRDIKPSNILVDRDGRPRLLDFGIAKLMTDNDGGPARTVAGQQLLTPQYASPEQVLGQSITTATDVYSLGVLLYELLTGQSPYARWRDEPLGVQRAICETDPPRPSQSLRGAETLQQDDKILRLSRSLAGDLDAIVLKAMRKEPAARYSSPAALAEDLQRFLDGKPVLARQGTMRYRTAKYLRRHAVGVAAGSAMVMGSAGFAAYHMARVTSERDVAQRERATAEHVSDFMVDLLTYANPEQRDPDTRVRELLIRGGEKIEVELAAQQPEIAARLLHTMAKGHQGLGNLEQAAAGYRRSVDLFRSAGRLRDPHYIDMLRAYTQLLVQLEDWETFESVADEAVRLSRDVLGPDSVQHADVLQIRAQGLLRLHRRDAAILRDLETVAGILDTQSPPDHHLLSFLYSQMSSWYKLNYDYPAALVWAQRSKDEEALVAGPDARGMLWLDEDLARVYWRLGDCPTAIGLYQQGLELLARYKGPDHLDMNWSYYFMARCQLAMGDYAAAGESLNRLLAIEENAMDMGEGRYLSRALAHYGAYLADLGRFDLALAAVQRSERVLNAGLGPHSVEHFHVQFGFARIFTRQQQWPAAVAHWRRYVDLRRRELDPQAPQIALGELRLADALLSSGELEEAAERVHSALPRLQAIHGNAHPEYGLGLSVRARLRQLEGDTENALGDYADALAALPREKRNDVEVADILTRYALLLEQKQRDAAALALRARAAGIRDAVLTLAISGR